MGFPPSVNKWRSSQCSLENRYCFFVNLSTSAMKAYVTKCLEYNLNVLINNNKKIIKTRTLRVEL